MAGPSNPFQVTLLAQGESFADREGEVARIREAWESPGAKLVVYGERRMGKTAAMEVAAALARGRSRPVVIVNLATAVDLPDAMRRLLTAVHSAVGRSWKTLLQDLAAKLRVTVTVTPDPAGSGLPGLSLGLEPAATAVRPGVFTDTLDAIEAQLARRGTRLGIGLDEFQRLLLWGGEDVEWALKASLEKHRHISYVLAGSSRSMIEEMVTNKHRALWKTVDTLALGPIPPEAFAAWIVRRAKASGVRLGRDVAESIVVMAGPRTRDVVLLAAATWEDARQHGGEGNPTRAMDVFVAATDALHRRLWDQATGRERRLLRALAADRALEPTSSAARATYALGAPSTVAKALASLVARELLGRDGQRYVFDDPCFRRWVELNTLADLGLPDRTGHPLRRTT